MFEKVGKLPLNIAYMLIFHIQKESTLYQYSNLNI